MAAYNYGSTRNSHSDFYKRSMSEIDQMNKDLRELQNRRSAKVGRDVEAVGVKIANMIVGNVVEDIKFGQATQNPDKFRHDMDYMKTMIGDLNQDQLTSLLKNTIYSISESSKTGHIKPNSQEFSQSLALISAINGIRNEKGKEREDSRSNSRDKGRDNSGDSSRSDSFVSRVTRQQDQGFSR